MSMFDAYNIAIKLSLINGVSPTLNLLSGQFAALDARAELFQNRLKQIKSLAVVGGTLFGAGILGAFAINKLMQPAFDYSHQLNILKMAGLNSQEIAKATAAAWQTAHDVITSTPTQNLKSFIDIRNVLGNVDEAVYLMPMVAKMQAVLQASKEGRDVAASPNFAFSVAKALDIVGAASDMKDFVTQATLMSQVITAFQGRITPDQYQQVFKISRQAGFQLDNEFKYRYLPSLMLEYATQSGGGGGSKGVGPMLSSFYRFTNQGYINKKSLPLLEQLGLVNPSTALETTTSGTTVGAMSGAGLAATDPYLWVQKILLPAIYKLYGTNVSKFQIIDIINQITRGNQLAAAVMAQYAVKTTNFNRDADIAAKAMTNTTAFQQAIHNDPLTAMKALGAQWDTFETALTIPIVSVVIPSLITLSTWLNNVANILYKYPELAKRISTVLIGLSASMLFGGTVLLLTAGFRGLALVLDILKFPTLFITRALWGLVAPFVAPILPIIGIVAALGLLTYGVYKLFSLLGENGWKNNFSIFIDLLKKLFSVMGTIFTNILPGAGLVNSVINGIHHKNLKSPINSSNNNSSNNQTVVLKVNNRVLGHAVLSHAAKEANNIPNYVQKYDTSMSAVPVLLQR
jgi:hypothetical protein